MVGADREVGALSKLTHELVHRAIAELDHFGAAAADQVVPVPRLANDIRWIPTGFQKAVHNLDRGEDLKRTVDGGSSNCRQQRDNLLRREWSGLPDHQLHDFAARAGYPIPSIRKLRQNTFSVEVQRCGMIDRAHGANLPYLSNSEPGEERGIIAAC